MSYLQPDTAYLLKRHREQNKEATVYVGNLHERVTPRILHELMLNAGNLALIAFSRMHGNGEGQIFAIIVMVVAACEVAVGLGLIVAIFRRRLPIDVDEMRELQG